MNAPNNDFPVPPKPWTQKSIRELRDAIIRGEDRTEDLSYEDIYLWYSDILTKVVERLTHLRTPEDSSQRLKPSFRVKTITTLRDKLMRQAETPIYRIHDIIGARVTLDMSLVEQDVLAERVLSLFPKGRINDLRETPHAGYRAVHVILQLPRGIFAEVQLRTLLQDQWANCFETAGDVFGREIRYTDNPRVEVPSNGLEILKNASKQIATYENHANHYDWQSTQIPEINEDIHALSNALIQLNTILERFRDDA